MKKQFTMISQSLQDGLNQVAQESYDRALAHAQKIVEEEISGFLGDSYSEYELDMDYDTLVYNLRELKENIARRLKDD